MDMDADMGSSKTRHDDLLCDGAVLLESSKAGVLTVDVEGVVKYVNAMACHILARIAPLVIGQHLDRALGWDRAREQCPEARADFLRPPVREGREYHVFMDYVAADDEQWTPIEYWMVPVKFGGEVIGAVMTFHDISERLEADERMRRLAYHDSLTELPNRRLLLERLDYELSRAKRYGDFFALHLVDVDDFKSVNDRFGHPGGDQLLIRLADRMRAVVRESDTVARIGGDEFAVIQVAVTDPEDVAALAQKLLVECRKSVHINGFELFPGVTVGASLYADDQSLGGLWAQADVALYQAKKGGKDSFVVVDEDTTRSMQRDTELLAALETAIDCQQFELVYQPQFSVGANALVGVEALLRWRHPEFGDAGPANFIPIAEAHGLIHSIGLWVITEVCHQVRIWMEAGIPFGRVSFNVSPLQMASREHFDEIVAIVDGARVPWAALELEVTETAYFGASREVLAVLETLQRRGLRVAIDDFGTGYSSLLALRKMKANSLKIDQTFVHDLHDAESAGIVKETIALAHTLGMAAVAEGVELPSQLAFLDRHGCDRSQGFHLGRPSSVAALEQHFFAVDDGSSVAVADLLGEPDDESADDLIAWSDVYETGIAQIDLQHHKLVELINRVAREARNVSDNTAGRIGDVLEEIAQYVDYHFRCEEAFMARHHVCSHHVDHHRGTHLECIGQVQGWIAAYREGAFNLGDLCADLTHWLVGHILAEDKALGEQIAAINRGAAPEEAYRSSMISAAQECR